MWSWLLGLFSADGGEAPLRVLFGGILLALAVCVGAALGWTVRGGAVALAEARTAGVEAEFAGYREKAEKQRADAEAAARAAETEWRRKADETRKDFDARERKLKANVASARAAADGLRDELAAVRDLLADAPGAAVLATAHALDELFGECAKRYVEVAGAADGHALDAAEMSSYLRNLEADHADFIR
jgi:hypothetical protein